MAIFHHKEMITRAFFRRQFPYLGKKGKPFTNSFFLSLIPLSPSSKCKARAKAKVMIRAQPHIDHFLCHISFIS